MHETTAPIRVTLTDGPSINVDPTGEHVEVTITCGGRARAGIALSPREVVKLATALLDATALRDGNATGEDMEEHGAQVRRVHALVSLEDAPNACTPAQYVRHQRQVRDLEEAAR